MFFELSIRTSHYIMETHLCQSSWARWRKSQDQVRRQRGTHPSSCPRQSIVHPRTELKRPVGWLPEEARQAPPRAGHWMCWEEPLEMESSPSQCCLKCTCGSFWESRYIWNRYGKRQDIDIFTCVSAELQLAKSTKSTHKNTITYSSNSSLVATNTQIQKYKDDL